MEMFSKQIPKAFSSSRSSRTPSGPKLEFFSRSRSPSPTSHTGHPLPILNHPLQVPETTTHRPARVTDSNKQKGRGKIIGTIKSKPQTSGREMSENPKVSYMEDIVLLATDSCMYVFHERFLAWGSSQEIVDNTCVQRCRIWLGELSIQGKLFLHPCPLIDETQSVNSV